MEIALHTVVITPSEPSYICGHAMRVHLHTGVIDELYMSLLRLRSEGEEYLFASIDLVGLDDELVEAMKTIADTYGICKEHVILSVIHTHSGPEYMDINIFSGDSKTGARPGYRNFLVTKFEEALKGCIDFHEVSATYAETEIDGYYGNRNNKAYPCDKKAHFVKFSKDGQPICLLMNMSCHPTILGPQNYKLSADLFGWIRRDLEKTYHASVFMMNGAEGDVSNRQYRQGNDETELKRCGKGICEQLHELDFTPISQEPMKIKDITYVIDYMSDPKLLDIEIAKAKKRLATETNPDTLKVTKSGIAFMEVNKLQDPHVHEEIKTRILQIGEVIIVTVAAELFTKFSIQIKEYFPNKKIIIWGITDCSVGYLVEQNEYGKNYESMTTRIPKGEVEAYVKHIIENIENFIK